MDKYYIRKEDFEKIFICLSERACIYCKNLLKTRKFLESVYFIMRAGAQWSELPQYYGKYKNIHDRFIRWVKKEYGMRYFPILQKTVMRSHL